MSASTVSLDYVADLVAGHTTLPRSTDTQVSARGNEDVERTRQGNARLLANALTDTTGTPATSLTGRIEQGSESSATVTLARGGDLVRMLHFYSPPANDEKPAFRVTEANGVGYKNYPCSSHPVLIRDVRAHPLREPFGLSWESFQLLRSQLPPPDVDITDDDQVQKAYTHAAQELVLAHVPGAQHVVVFDHTIRRASAVVKLNRPVKKVHVDQSAKAAFLRAEAHLSEQQAEEVRQGKLRLRIINVWRPLKGPISDHPLCLAESPSIPEEDLVEIDHIYAHRVGETYHCRYRGLTDHRFWYLSSMEATDVWMIQCFDSVRDRQGRRRRCVHASFEVVESSDQVADDQATAAPAPEEGNQRESIEVRCLVLGGSLSDEEEEEQKSI